MNIRTSRPGWAGWPGLMGFCLGLLMTASSIPLASAADGRDFAYLPVYSQPAEDLLEVLRPMAGGGSVMAHGNQIIVHGTQAEIATVSEALERLDQPARRLMIEVRVAENSVGQRSGQHLSGSWQRTDGRDQVRINAGAREIHTQRQGDMVQRVQTLDGRPALIRTGQWRPVANAVANPVGVFVEQGYQSIDTGFYALPRAHGDEVTVELYQQDEQALPNGRMRGGSARTQVRGYLGEWLDVGGQQQFEEEGVRRWSTQNQGERHLQMRVRALD